MGSISRAVQFGRFRHSDSRAMSPVVGVVLMVTLAVFLSAIASGSVFGIASQSAGESPAVAFQAEWADDGGLDVLVLRHEAGTTLDSAHVTVRVGEEVLYRDGAYNPDALAVTGDGWAGSEITAGREVRFEETSDVFDSDDRLRVYYEVDGQSHVVFEEN